MKKFPKILFTTIISVLMLAAVYISASAANVIEIESYTRYTHRIVSIDYNVSADMDSAQILHKENGEFVSYNSISPKAGSYSDSFPIDYGEHIFRLEFKKGENVYRKDITVTATENHIFKKYYSNNDATCTQDGTEYSYCECYGCGKRDVRVAEGSAAHNYQTTVKAATTKKDGKKTVKCSVCGKTKSSSVISRISSMKFSKTSYTYCAKELTPTPIIKDAEGKVLKAGTDYKAGYLENKYVGKAEVYITFKGNYSGNEMLTFNIVPKKTSGLSAKAAKGGFTLGWTKNASQADGYEIQYSTKKDFSNYKNTFFILGRTTVSKKVSNLAGEKTYYVRIRAFKEVSGINYRSAWSDSVKVKTLKGYTGKKEKNADRYASAEKVLNAAALKPLLTNDDWLDAKIGSILKKITNDKMSTYEKVRAIHNYMVQNYQYKILLQDRSPYGYTSTYDLEVVSLAKSMLINKGGVCDHWSALFMVMTRRVGLESYVQNGQINVGEKWQGHVWNTIRVNGNDYVFDVEADFRNSNGGKTRYTNFCIAQTSKYKYAAKSANVKAFKEFKLGMK